MRTCSICGYEIQIGQEESPNDERQAHSYCVQVNMDYAAKRSKMRIPHKDGYIYIPINDPPWIRRAEKVPPTPSEHLISYIAETEDGSEISVSGMRVSMNLSRDKIRSEAENDARQEATRSGKKIKHIYLTSIDGEDLVRWTKGGAMMPKLSTLQETNEQKQYVPPTA